MKKQNGITLIALIITIVVILILVGVTISITLGENGIIQKSKEASTAQTAAQNKEMSELAGAGVESKIDAVVNGSGTQKISTKVTQGGEQTVYAYLVDEGSESDPDIVIYNIGDVFYRDYDHDGTLYYSEPGQPRAIGSELAGELENILGISGISADTYAYGIFDDNYGVVKINNSWYWLDEYAGPQSDAVECVAFTQTYVDASIFESAVDFNNYVESGS